MVYHFITQDTDTDYTADTIYAQISLHENHSAHKKSTENNFSFFSALPVT